MIAWFPAALDKGTKSPDSSTRISKDSTARWRRGMAKRPARARQSRLRRSAATFSSQGAVPNNRDSLVSMSSSWHQRLVCHSDESNRGLRYNKNAIAPGAQTESGAVGGVGLVRACLAARTSPAVFLLIQQLLEVRSGTYRVES